MDTGADFGDPSVTARPANTEPAFDIVRELADERARSSATSSQDVVEGVNEQSVLMSANRSGYEHSRAPKMMAGNTNTTADTGADFGQGGYEPKLGGF